MSSKILSFFLLTAILSIAMVSATVNSDISFSLSPAELSKSTNQTTLTITNNGIAQLTMNLANIVAISDGNGHTIPISFPVATNPIIVSASGGTKQVILSHSLTDAQKKELALGTYSTTIEVADPLVPADKKTGTLNFISGFCKIGEVSDAIDTNRLLTIDSVKDKSSDNDWEWKPLDEVEIEVKVSFDNPDDDNDNIDGIIKIWLYDSTGKEVDLSESNDDEDLEKEISLDEGDSIRETFILNIPVEDIDDGTYRLYVKAYEDGKEDKLCIDNSDSLEDGNGYYQEVSIDKSTYDVILDKLDVTTPVPCEGEVELTGRLYNIGTHDEDKVIAALYNKELGLDLKSDAYALDSGDSQKISFSFKIPENITEKTYTLILRSEFKYSKSSGDYKEKSEIYELSLKVEGNCEKAEVIKNIPQITAELDSETPEAIAGKQVIIKANIKNTGNATTTYTLSVFGNSAWSSLSVIEPQIITLNAGESKLVNILLDIDEDAEGDKEFTIKANYDGASTEQKVALSITKEQIAGITGSVIGEHLKENWFIYVIAVVNIILIIAIIAVVKSMVGRTSVR